MSGDKVDPQEPLLTGLRDLGQHVRQARDQQSALAAIAGAAVSLAGATRAMIILGIGPTPSIGPEHGLEVAAACGLAQDEAEALLSAQTGELIWEVITTGQPTYPGEGGPHASAAPLSANQLGSDAVMCLPLRIGDEAVGALYVERNGEFGPFEPRHRLVLELVAQWATGAIRRWELEERVGRTLTAKGKFVSLVTHQLRVPLTSVVGYTDLLLSGMVGPLNEKQYEFLSTIKRNLERMNVLIQDLSDINRLDAGRADLDIAPFSVSEAVHVVAARMRDTIGARGHRLSVRVESDLPKAMADKNRFCQVLEGLMINASQYTPAGGNIGVAATGQWPFVAVTVHDTGIGISEADQARIFEEFYRSEDESVREIAGWGLGLPLAKRLVEAQGGEIHFTSRPGHGTTFTFTVPAAGAEAGHNQPQT